MGAFKGKGMKDHNSRAMMMAGVKPSPVEPRSESGNTTTRQGRWAVAAGNREPLKKINGLNDQLQKKLREEEKTQNVLHLIFWGPK
ncbi:hypothetical protein ACH5RR_028922 [Cinchona calisaya]|uniref:Uncharacterized protein n=1 Tax=Cinchona calisaya TaxID=153742 RepID=A0ABD2YRL2_9GENT